MKNKNIALGNTPICGEEQGSTKLDDIQRRPPIPTDLIDGVWRRG